MVKVTRKNADLEENPNETLIDSHSVKTVGASEIFGSGSRNNGKNRAARIQSNKAKMDSREYIGMVELFKAIGTFKHIGGDYD